ncbi:uncharacterized protein LOC143427907 isoform X2 [Xylocopa sonorina]|uniref:uncharacterized protein LOC143427907 isoform X2 n=1 Tax=Xylocopa sonorina TaxID=1818115 RepID=UPI00403AF1F5
MAHTMNTLTILLLSTLICAGSTQSSVTSSTTVQPFSIRGILSNVEKGIITGPEDILNLIRSQVLNFIENVINTLGLTIEPLVQNIDSTIDQLCSLAAPTNNSSRRRRDLLGLIPSNLRQLLPSNLTYLIETPINATSGQIRGVANETVQLLEQFLVSEGLPWLHQILDNINSTHLLPTFLSSLINRIDILYNALELLGYVGS